MVEEVGNDVGGLVGSVAGGVCVHRWYTRGRGGVGATNGARTTDGTSRGTSSTVEGKRFLMPCLIAEFNRTTLGNAITLFRLSFLQPLLKACKVWIIS